MSTKNLKPEAYISIGKNRQKVYEGKNVYLKNNQEFEFEMFNPSSCNVMARISINGNRISDKGIVLRPGMRGWLDRFIDENRKFLFETYTVGTSAAVQKAIENNGVIKIEFFREQQKRELNLLNVSCDQTPPKKRYKSCLSKETLDSIDYVDYSQELSRRIVDSSFKKTVETGRVEKGGTSDQYFKMVNMEFEMFSFHTIEYKILPESEMKIQINQIKLKCNKCGTKIKQGWKVCPVCTHPINEEGVCEHCGTELDPVWKVCPMCGEPI